MRTKRFFASLFCIVMLAVALCGVTAIAFAESTSYNPLVLGARSDGETEYRILIDYPSQGAAGVKSWNMAGGNDEKIVINGKTLKDYKTEGKISQVYCNDSNPVMTGVRIDLPNYGKDILKLDGTDTVILKQGFASTTGETVNEDQTTVLTLLKLPTVNYGFPDGITVENDAFTTDQTALTFKPVFAPGNGAAVQNVKVKLNALDIVADENGNYNVTLKLGTNTIEFFCEENAEPYAFVRKIVTVTVADPVVEGPISISTGTFVRNAEGRPAYYDSLTLRFTNYITVEKQADFSLTINDKNLEQMNAIGANVVKTQWSADGREVVVKTLFFNADTKLISNIYKYDGTDTIVVSGVTAEPVTLKRTADGQIYKSTEDAPANLGGINVKQVVIERDHEGKNKDAIRIDFDSNVDIKGNADLNEGVLLFNTNTILVNGHNLQALWDANHDTKAFWVNGGQFSFLRIDLYWDGVSEEIWNRNGDNVVTINASFVTMTNKVLASGFKDYTLDNSVDTMELSVKSITYFAAYEAGNDWIQIAMNEDAWPTPAIAVQANTHLTDNIIINGKTLTAWKAELKKLEIHAGTEGANTVRLTISSDGDFAKLFKKDGTDTFVIKAGFGLDKYIAVKDDFNLTTVTDVTLPVLTLTKPTSEVVNSTEHEIKFTATDDTGVTATVTLDGATIAPNADGKYLVTLSEGQHTVVVKLKDGSFFKNRASDQYTITYEAMPEITVSGLTDGSTVKQASQKLTISVTDGTIESVKLGTAALTAGTDGKYALTLADGVNVITIVAKNGTTTTTKTINVTLDKTAPVITVSVNDGDEVSKEDLVFTVTTNEESTLSVKLNGTILTKGADGKYSAKLQSGENTITVTATDGAGNIATKNVKVSFVAGGNNSSNSTNGDNTSSEDKKGKCSSATISELVAFISLAAAALVVFKRK